MKSCGDWHRFLQEITPEKALLCIDSIRSQSQSSFFTAFSPSQRVQHRYGKHTLRVTRPWNRAGTASQIPQPCVCKHEFSLDNSTAHTDPLLSLWMCRSCLIHVCKMGYLLWKNARWNKVLTLTVMLFLLIVVLLSYNPQIKTEIRRKSWSHY